MKTTNKTKTKEQPINWSKVWSIFEAFENANALIPVGYGDVNIFNYEWEAEISGSDLVLLWNKSGSILDDKESITFTPNALSAATIKGNILTAKGAWDYRTPDKTESTSIELLSYIPHKIKNIVRTAKDRQRLEKKWKRRLAEVAELHEEPRE